MADRTCVVCATPLTGRHVVTCSQRCRVWRQNRSPAYLAAKSRYRNAGREPVLAWEITCAWCQQPAQVRNRRARFCSNECGQAARFACPAVPGPAACRPRIRSVRWRDAQQRLHAAAAGSRSRRAVWAAGRCRRCGEAFVCMVTNTPPAYCSTRCLKGDSKARRRAMEHSALVEMVSRFEVFERDRWMCRLCGKRVKRTAEVPDPKAPVLDHIVPLAAGPANGGVHAPWNVQCAHFRCNSIKCASYEQGALF